MSESDARVAFCSLAGSMTVYMKECELGRLCKSPYDQSCMFSHFFNQSVQVQVVSHY